MSITFSFFPYSEFRVIQLLICKSTARTRRLIPIDVVAPIGDLLLGVYILGPKTAPFQTPRV